MKQVLFTLAVLFSGFSVVTQTQAQPVVTFTATINPGTLLTDVRNALGEQIPNPRVPLGKVVNAIDCRSSGLTGTLGNDSQRLYVYNPKAAFDGWTLTIAPAAGPDAQWEGEESAFDFNDPGLDGCIDTDNDGVAGLLSIDPSTTTIAADCLACTTENLSLGHTQALSFAERDSITLLKANSLADELGRWYITGIDVTQSIPPAQDGDTYEIDMVLTATAT
jgi:hypothetical protein